MISTIKILNWPWSQFKVVVIYSHCGLLICSDDGHFYLLLYTIYKYYIQLLEITGTLTKAKWKNNEVMRGLKVFVAPNHRIASPSPVIRALILYFCHHYKQEHNKGQLERDSRFVLTVCQRCCHRDNKQNSNINRWHISHHTWNTGLHLKQTNKPKSGKRKPLQVPNKFVFRLQIKRQLSYLHPSTDRLHFCETAFALLRRTFIRFVPKRFKARRNLAHTSGWGFQNKCKGFADKLWANSKWNILSKLKAKNN